MCNLRLPSHTCVWERRHRRVNASVAGGLARSDTHVSKIEKTQGILRIVAGALLLAGAADAIWRQSREIKLLMPVVFAFLLAYIATTFLVIWKRFRNPPQPPPAFTLREDVKPKKETHSL